MAEATEMAMATEAAGKAEAGMAEVAEVAMM